MPPVWRLNSPPGLFEKEMVATMLRIAIRIMLVAALIIGLCWGLWHLPRDITTGVIDRLGFATYLLQFLPSFVLGTVAVSVIAAYFMNRLGGSLLVPLQHCDRLFVRLDAFEHREPFHGGGGLGVILDRHAF